MDWLCKLNLKWQTSVAINIYFLTFPAKRVHKKHALAQVGNNFFNFFFIKQVGQQLYTSRVESVHRLIIK